MRRSCPHLDKTLGSDANITRREFLDGALLASGSILLGSAAPGQTMAQDSDWTGYTGAYRVLGMDQKTYGFYFGAKFGKNPGVWVVDPWGKNLEGCPFPGKQRQELLAWRRGERREAYKLGISGGQWFEGIGGYVEVRKMAKFGVDTPYVGPDLPTVLTFFIDFAKPGLPAAEQGHKGRIELLSTSYGEYEGRIREQMTEMFGASGFDARRDIAGIVLNRWGHAFINPQPGFFFGANGKAAPRDALRNAPFGRIAFSHSDLAGAMDHRNAFMESNRAVGQLLNQVLV